MLFTINILIFSAYALVAAAFSMVSAKLHSALSSVRPSAVGGKLRGFAGDSSRLLVSFDASTCFDIMHTALPIPIDQLAAFAPDMISFFAIVAGVSIFSAFLAQRAAGLDERQAAQIAKLSNELAWSKQRIAFFEEVNEQRNANRIYEKHQLEMERQKKYFSDRLVRCNNQHQADQNEIRSLQHQLRTLQTAFSAPPSPSASSLDSPSDKSVNMFEPVVCLESKKQLKRKASFVPSTFRIKLVRSRPAVDGLGIRSS